MNPSENFPYELIEAKSRQRRIYGIAVIGTLLTAVLVWFVLVFSNGFPVEIHPKEAGETSNLTVVGWSGFAVGNTAYSAFDAPIIRLMAPGFRTEQKALSPNDAGKIVKIRMVELPGTLLVQTIPKNKKTRWKMDGKLISISETLNKEIFSGEHALEIDSPYYQMHSFQVTMGRAETKKILINLEEVSGEISIKSQPSGADVYFDGELVGKSPVVLQKNGGSYRVEVQRLGYGSVVEEIEVTNSKPRVKRLYNLPPKLAYLNLEVSPEGGILLLNGREKTKLHRIPVKAKSKNTITYAKAGYFSRTRKLILEPDEEKKIIINLQPEVGRVEVRSSPVASIFVNNNLVGDAPRSLNLPAFPHKIVIKKTGFRPQKRVVTPSSKSIQKISVKLETELALRLREAPKKFENSVGIQLKLFHPNEKFVMGAPRHEKGQRANEFLRTVVLRKPFYISRYEITGSQYAPFARGKKRKVTTNEPISSVSWLQAARYCNWLSQKEGLVPFYRFRGDVLIGTTKYSDGYRLPTEAEWEWLARKAGRKKQVKFTWGDSETIPPMIGNIADEKAKGKTFYYVPNYTDGYQQVAPVGRFPIEASGLHDLTGNVSEWVHDVYSLIPPEKGKVDFDPLGPHDGEIHVIKGSNWRSGNITELRASYRQGGKAGDDDIGFRVARYLYGGPYAED